MNTRFITALIKPFVPLKLKVFYRNWSARKYGNKTVTAAFSVVYQKNLWGGSPGEYFSGTGSIDPSVEEYVSIVNEFIKANSISRVVDLGCGDFRVGRKLVSPQIMYFGVDVVPGLIKYNQTRYGNNNVTFECLDIITDKLPDADLCLIRQVLQHLSNAEIMHILKNIRQYKYVIITEHIPSERHTKIANIDQPHGPQNRLINDSGVFLDQPPFNVEISEVLLKRKAQDYSLYPDELLFTCLLKNR